MIDHRPNGTAGLARARGGVGGGWGRGWGLGVGGGQVDGRPGGCHICGIHISVIA